MKISRREFTLATMSAGLGISGKAALAETYPSKVVKIVIPFPVGGLVDNHSRALANALTNLWKQTVIVEARPGGNGVIATEYSVRSAPDGYTLYNGNDAPIAMNPALYKNLSYDPIRDLAPIACMVAATSILVVHPSVPARTLLKFVDYARAKPGQINYGSFGIGSKTHVDTEALSNLLNINLTHVPYKGIADVTTALVAGEIQFAMGGTSVLAPQIAKGTIFPLAMTGTVRSTALPDVPTITESGGPEFISRSWFGLFAPANTPRAIVDRVAADVAQVSKEATFDQKYVRGFGLDPLILGPNEFGAMIRKDIAFYKETLSKMNLQLD